MGRGYARLLAYDPARQALLATLTLEVGIKPEIRAAADKELPPDYPPADIGPLPGDADEYVITGGGLKGLRGFFTRDDGGQVVGVDLAGRLYNRVV